MTTWLRREAEAEADESPRRQDRRQKAVKHISRTKTDRSPSGTGKGERQ